MHKWSPIVLNSYVRPTALDRLRVQFPIPELHTVGDTLPKISQCSLGLFSPFLDLCWRMGGKFCYSIQQSAIVKICMCSVMIQPIPFLGAIFRAKVSTILTLEIVKISEITSTWVIIFISVCEKLYLPYIIRLIINMPSTRSYLVVRDEPSPVRSIER